MPKRFDIMLDPQKYGYIECPHCNGYGSSLKDPDGVDTCTKCNGWGVIKERKSAEWQKNSPTKS
jgi:DnaJ-class molecular chaperone